MQLTSHLNVLHSQQNTMMYFLKDQIEHIVLKKHRSKVNRKRIQKYNDTFQWHIPFKSSFWQLTNVTQTLTREVAVDGFEEGGSLWLALLIPESC